MVTKNDIKFIKSLKLKKNRIQQGLFCVEGSKNVIELITSGQLEIVRLIGTISFEEQIGALGELGSLRMERINQRDLEAMSNFQTNNSVIALVKIPDKQHVPTVEEQCIVLDGVRDPGNLGTIIRTMDWFGFTSLICSEDCVDLYNPKTISATMGSFARVDVHYLDLKNFITANQERKVFAMVLDGKPMSSLEASEGIYLLGNESQGIREELMPFIDEKITIPKRGSAESLNVAIAHAMMVYHLKAL